MEAQATPFVFDAGLKNPESPCPRNSPRTTHRRQDRSAPSFA
jgi:hypothetical protein